MTIQQVNITNLYGNNYKWQLNPDVNILVGANGTYKSSIIKLLKLDDYNIPKHSASYPDYLANCPNLEVEIVKDPIVEIELEAQAEDLNQRFLRADKLIKEIIPNYKSYQECSQGQRSLLSIFAYKTDIIFLDNPENNLHIDWQRNLIKWIRELNPNCQIIMTSHSPCIMTDWENSIIQIEDIKVN